MKIFGGFTADVDVVVSDEKVPARLVGLIVPWIVGEDDRNAGIFQCDHAFGTFAESCDYAIDAVSNSAVDDVRCQFFWVLQIFDVPVVTGINEVENAGKAVSSRYAADGKCDDYVLGFHGG